VIHVFLYQPGSAGVGASPDLPGSATVCPTDKYFSVFSKYTFIQRLTYTDIRAQQRVPYIQGQPILNLLKTLGAYVQLCYRSFCNICLFNFTYIDYTTIFTVRYSQRWLVISLRPICYILYFILLYNVAVLVFVG